jgi:hypothetical protein
MQKIEQNANEFTTASGRTYYIYSSMSAARYVIAQKLEAEMQAGTTIGQVVAQTKKAYECLNTSKNADAAVILFNVNQEADRVLNEQPDSIMLYCTLFMCEKGEDTGKWNETDAQSKIEDWSDIDAAFFLKSFKRFLIQFMRDLNTSTPNSSQDQEGDPFNE